MIPGVNWEVAPITDLTRNRRWATVEQSLLAVSPRHPARDQACQTAKTSDVKTMIEEQ